MLTCLIIAFLGRAKFVEIRRLRPDIIEEKRVATAATHRLEAMFWVKTNLFTCGPSHQRQSVLSLLSGAELLTNSCPSRIPCLAKAVPSAAVE